MNNYIPKLFLAVERNILTIFKLFIDRYLKFYFDLC